MRDTGETLCGFVELRDCGTVSLVFCGVSMGGGMGLETDILGLRLGVERIQRR